MGLFYRCIVTYTLFGEVIDDISWNYMPEPGCPDAGSESSNLVSLQSHPLFQKDASMSSTSAHRPLFKKCLYVFNISRPCFQEDACMSSTRHRPQRKNLSLAFEEA